MKFRACAVSLAVAACWACPRPVTDEAVTVPGLGTLAFPVQAETDSARNAFQRGALLLHLFHYEDARTAFRVAQAVEPRMVMAYWGEAMTWTHGVWNEQEADSARATLGRLAPTRAVRREMASSDREAAYLDAVEVLYGNGPKARRDTLYADAMVRVVEEYPDDDEARLFYALALLSLNQGVRDVPTYLRAADIAEEVFRRRPTHPGASHYLIHAVDDPEHAARGLDAARALAASSPDAGHGQHMTSHIFMALGMWQDVVEANENSMRVVNTARARRNLGPAYCGHSNTWLNYGYLELGRTEEARRLTRACREQAESLARERPGPTGEIDPDNSPLGSAVFIWARYVLDTEDWSGEDTAWAPEGIVSGTPTAATYYFVQGFAAVERGDLSAARTALSQVRRSRAAGERLQHTPEVVEYLGGLDTMILELEGLMRLATGDDDGGLGQLREAAAREAHLAYAFGPPAVVKPASELLGEELARRGAMEEAEAAFRNALARAPGRTASLRGLTHVLNALGRGAEADSLSAAQRSRQTE